MATLHEYFVKDGNKNLTTQSELEIKDEQGKVIIRPVARVHHDFEAHATYMSIYVPSSREVECPEALLLNMVEEVLKKQKKEILIQSGFGSLPKIDARELIFTGKIYIYSERPVLKEHMARLIEESKGNGHKLEFRSTQYMEERNKYEKPRAFISHDSRDKLDIAEPLALEFSKRMCPVWYDEFALKVGDSLRESIEKGLRNCHKCVFVITPNFLKNGGWAKREYDSIFTRELVEEKKLIIPIWCNVTQRDIYEYSPMLADRVAVNWSSGKEEVARKIISVIDQP